MCRIYHDAIERAQISLTDRQVEQIEHRRRLTNTWQMFVIQGETQHAGCSARQRRIS